MDNHAKQGERLDAIAAEVRRLRVTVIDTARVANELLDGEAASGEATNLALAARVMLIGALDRYFEESEAVRSTSCPIHGDRMVIVSCPECVARLPELRPLYDSYLAAVRSADEAAQ